MVLAFGNLHKTFITIVSLHNRLKRGCFDVGIKKHAREHYSTFFVVEGLGNEDFVLRDEEPGD